MLAAGPVVASLALLACWALGRRLVGPGWALLVPAGLALHLGWVAVARGTYTEPTQLALLAGGLAVAVDAARDRSGWRSVVAGVLLGTAAATRVDGVLVLAALAVAVVVGLLVEAAGARAPGGRRRLALLVLGAVPPVAVGVLDLTTTVPGYLGSLSTRLALALGATVVAAVLAVPAVRLVRRRRVRAALTPRRLGAAAVAVVVVAGAVLASRPLWFTGRRVRPDDQAGLEVLQRAFGLEVDGARSYDEDTLVWVAWYSGVPLLVLAAVGLVAAAWGLGARGRRDLLLPMAVLAVAGGAFLWAPSIFPDQVWASRRLLVVVVPGLLLAAAGALGLLGPVAAGRQARRRRSWRSCSGCRRCWCRRRPRRPRCSTSRSGPGEADLVADLCRAADGRPGVVLVGEAVARRLPVTLAAACDVPAVAAPEGWPESGDLAAVVDAAGSGRAAGDGRPGAAALGERGARAAVAAAALAEVAGGAAAAARRAARDRAGAVARGPGRRRGRRGRRGVRLICQGATGRYTACHAWQVMRPGRDNLCGCGPSAAVVQEATREDGSRGAPWCAAGGTCRWSPSWPPSTSWSRVRTTDLGSESLCPRWCC